MIFSGPTASGHSHGDQTTGRGGAVPGGGSAIARPRPAPQERSARAPTARSVTPISQALRLAVERPARGVVVVRMIGDIDLAAIPRLTELIGQRLTAAALRAVVLDLSEVSFLNSAGLELLLHVQRRAEHRGVALFMVSGSRCVDRLLYMTGLSERFDLRARTAEAVAETLG